MKALSAACFFLLASPAYASLTGCFDAITNYEASISEADFNVTRVTALATCKAEVFKIPKAKRAVLPLLNQCEKFAARGDAGPRLMDSCKIDAYRYGINFED